MCFMASDDRRIREEFKMRLEGNRIVLTEMTDSDTKDIVRWRNQDFVRRMFLYQEPFTCKGHRSWIKNMIETGKAVQFIIREKDTGNKIGSVYLRDIDRVNLKAEFGIFIGEEDKLGCGYGKEAAKLITEYGFLNLGLNKIFLRVVAENERARKSYKRAGFTEEGLLKEDRIINGEKKDLIFMAKFAGEKGKK